MRSAVLLAVAVVAVGVLASGATAAGVPVRATLTAKVSLATPPGHSVVVKWRLRDAAGDSVALKHVTLRIVCPTHDAYTTTTATLLADGTYRATAFVPPGGIGTLSIRAAKRTFLIKLR